MQGTWLGLADYYQKRDGHRQTFPRPRDRIAGKNGYDLPHLHRQNVRYLANVRDAVQTYLFNTQLITLPDGRMIIVAPTECEENPRVAAYLQQLVSQGGAISDVRFFDVKQSMRNGGGPACLRLRVAMNDAEVAAVNPHVMLNEQLFTRLNQWVDKHYRDELAVADLHDPQLLVESRQALDELTQILHLGSVYPFQRDA